VAFPALNIIGRQQYLGTVKAVVDRSLLVEVHQSRLADRRVCLQLGQRPGAPGSVEDDNAGPDRTGSDNDDLNAFCPQRRNLSHQLADAFVLGSLVDSGNQAGADFDDNPSDAFQGFCPLSVVREIG